MAWLPRGHGFLKETLIYSHACVGVRIFSEAISVSLNEPIRAAGFPGGVLSRSFDCPRPAFLQCRVIRARPLPGILLGWLLLLSVPLQAAPQDAWGFAALVQLTLRDYPALLAGERRRMAAEADRSAAAWQRFPTPGAELTLDDDEASTAVLSLEQPLWTAGRISAGIDAGDARLAAADSALDETRDQIVTRLAEAFIELRRRQAQLEIAAANIDELEQLRAMIARRVDQAASPSSDLDLAESRLSQARVERASIVQASAGARARLSELTGVTVEQLSDEPLPGLEIPLDLAAAQRAAADNNPELRRLENETLASSADLRAARASRYPSLSLRLEQREQQGGRLTAGSRSESRALLLVQSDFGAGFSRNAEIGAAAARRDALSEERNTAIRDLRSDVADAWFLLREAGARLESARLNRDAAARVSASYSRQYVIGQASWLDLMNAVREASSAALGVEDARADRDRATLQLAILTGTLWQGALITRNNTGS